MSGSINSVVIVGRLVRDPEVIELGQYRKCRFTVACDRFTKDDRDEADFISCIAWNQSADFLGKYAEKGNLVSVTGSIRTGSYEKDNRKIYTTDINADRVQILESKKARADYPNNGKPLRREDIDTDDGFIQEPENDPGIPVNSDDLPF